MLTTEQHNNNYSQLLISNFLYSPKIRNVQHGSLSFVVLCAIKESEEPTFDKVKQEFTKLSGLDICDDNFFEEAFGELHKNGYLCNDKLKCTEKGIKHLEYASRNYEKLKVDVEKYFIGELKRLYCGKYHQDFDFKSNVTEKLIRRFWHCLEHNAILKFENIRNIFRVGAIKNEMSNKCIKCYCQKENPFHEKDLDNPKNRIMSVYYDFINNFNKQSKIPDKIENIQTIYQYSLLVSELLPLNNGIRTFFEDDFKNKYFYLDTNVIICALAHYDKNNIYIDTFLKKLKKLNQGSLNIFWDSETEDELKEVFRSSKSLIKALECYSSLHLQQITSSVALPSFVIDYFGGNWHNVESYGTYLRKRYLKLKNYSKETNKKLNRISGNDAPTNNFTEREYKTYAKKSGLRLKHDVKMIAELLNLRKQSLLKNKNKLISDHWIITFDDSLIKFQESENVKKEFQAYGVQPICVGLNALKLLMEPYILTKSSEFKGEINTLKLKESILLNLDNLYEFEDFFKIQENLNDPQRLIGEYLKKENINEFTYGK